MLTGRRRLWRIGKRPVRIRRRCHGGRFGDAIVRPVRGGLTIAGLLVLACMSSATVSAEAAPAAASAYHPAPCGARGHRPPDIRHIIVIVIENESEQNVIGHAKYMTALAHACGLATNYHAIRHPSLPNYLAMTSGGTHGVKTDCLPRACSVNSRSIFEQLGRHHKRWQAFDESMPHRCALIATGLYAPRHNPAVYYPRIRRGCLRHDRRLGSPAGGPFHKALHGHLGSYVFVTPNMCNDAHDCPLSVADRWLSRWIPAIRHSRSYAKRHTAIVITFDEGGGDNHVATIVVSPYTRAGSTSSAHFTHYSLLHACESVLGVGYLGHATNAGGFGRAFRLAG
jgi:phosphatidylinositol-3-phosphatase